MKNKNIKVVSTALALTTVLGITAGIAINTNKQMETLGYTPVNAMSIDARSESKDDFATIDSHMYDSVIGGTAINEYATYVEYQNVDGSHEIRSWGYNHDGLLGNGDSNESTKLGWAEATKVDLDMTGKTLKFMESLNDTIFVVLEDNDGGADEVWAWGNNDKGQLFIDGEDYVSTPTRILEDVIPTWGSIMGIDASIGSTIIYFQGTEGEEFDPANYNNESLYIYGAGDTSKDQDAKLGFFDAPMKLGSAQYIDSDASNYAYTLMYKLASDEPIQDTRILSWGDNSNGILGTGDTEQPEEGYFAPAIHDEGINLDEMGSFWADFNEITVLERVDASADNFVYGAHSKLDNFKDMPVMDMVFATGSKELDGGFGYYDGLNVVESVDHHGWNSTNAPESRDWTYNDMEIVNGKLVFNRGELRGTFIMDNYIEIYDDESTIDAPMFSDETYHHFATTPEAAVNFWTDDTTEIGTYLDSNDKTALWTISTDSTKESRYEINAWGSNSNGIFDKYSDSGESDKDSVFTFNTDIYNYNNIKVELIEDSVHSTSLEFTVDTSNDSGMINPNSYQLNIKANGEDFTDKLELVSFKDGVATYKLNNLSRATTYDFEYSFNETDTEYKQAFSATTTDKVAPDPVINSAEFIPAEETTYYKEMASDDYYNSGDAFKADVIDYGADLYTIDAAWDIEDVSEVSGEQTTIEKIEIVADEKTAGGTVYNGKKFVEIDYPEWKGESSNLKTYLYNNGDDSGGVNVDWESDTIIEPGSELTNVHMNLYANQNTTPIIYEMEDYSQPDLLEVDALYKLQIYKYYITTKDEISLAIQTHIYDGAAELLGRPTHVESDIEFTNLEFISMDERLTEDNFSYNESSFATGSFNLDMIDLELSTTYDDLVIKFDWIDHLTGETYSQTVDVVNDFGIDLTTEGWDKPDAPILTFNEVSTDSTSSTFTWTVQTKEPANEDQSVAQINKVSIEDRTNGTSYDVTEDMIVIDEHTYNGVSTIEGLTPESQYKFELKVNYSDLAGQNVASIESTIITINTGDYLDALQPTIKLEEGTPGYDSITVDYTITLPDPEANPENRPTELYSVELYINDETTPAVVSEEGDLSDTNTDGEITGTLTASGLDPETSYDWHIEVVSNAERVVGATHTTTTEMLAEPNAPRIVTGSTSLTATDDYNVFKFDYTLDIDEEVAGQSPAFIDSVEFVYKGEVIGQQPFKNGNPSSQSGQPIPDGGFVGSFDVTGIDWNIDVTDAVLRVGYSGSSEGQNYSVDLNIDSLSSPSLNTEGVQPNIKRAQVATNGGFKQISSTEAVISYSVETPAVTLGTAAVRIDDIRIVDGTEVIARTTEHSGNILLTNLEAGTLYSTLKLEVDYTYVRPSYDNNAGDDLGYESGTVSQNVTPFKTLDEGEFSLSGNVQYVGYNEGNLEGVLTVFDSGDAFIPENFRVSVKEGTGESAVRVEKAVEVTSIESTKSDKAESGIETTEYKIVIKDIQEGVQYTSWKYTMSTLTHPEDSEWISFKIEDPITGNEFNTFYMPPTITNHNMIYIILDVILLVSVLGLTVPVAIKATKKNDGDEDEEDETSDQEDENVDEDETEAEVEEETKTVKGGKNE